MNGAAIICIFMEQVTGVEHNFASRHSQVNNKTLNLFFAMSTRKDIRIPDIPDRIYNILRVHLLVASVRDEADNIGTDKQRFSNSATQASIFGPQHDDLGAFINGCRVSHVFQEYRKKYFYSTVSSNHDVFRAGT